MTEQSRLWGSGLRSNDGLNYGAWVGRVYHPVKSRGTIVPSLINGRGCGNQIERAYEVVVIRKPLHGLYECSTHSMPTWTRSSVRMERRSSKPNVVGLNPTGSVPNIFMYPRVTER